MAEDGEEETVGGSRRGRGRGSTGRDAERF